MRPPAPRSLALAILLSALVQTVGPFGPDRCLAASVSREGAALRAERGFSGRVLASPRPGEAVEVLERSNEWRRVRLSSGREGWLHELFLAEESLPDPLGSPSREWRAAPAPVPAPSTGALPQASPFASPAIREEEPGGEREGAAPGPGGAVAEELSRSGTESARQAERRARQDGELAVLREELARLRAELAPMRVDLAEAARREQGLLWRVEQLSNELATARSEADASRAAAAPAAARLQGLEARLARGGEDHAAELARLQGERDRALAALRVELEARHRDEVEQERRIARAELQRLEAEHAAALLSMSEAHDEDQDLVGERFVVACSALHERELQRSTEGLRAECQATLLAERQAHAREIEKVSRKSGWQEDFDTEVDEAVRARLQEQLDEAKLRWEARHRGEVFRLERTLEQKTLEQESACESRVLAAVNAELERHRRELNERLSAARVEEERRCRLALELILERAAAGASPAELRGEGVPRPGGS